MEISLKVKNNGIQKGTIGWLAENAAILKVDETDDGRRAVWLESTYHGNITILAVAGFDDGYGYNPGISSLARQPGEYTPCALNFPVTDACWKALDEMADKAVEILEQDEPAKKVVFEDAVEAEMVA